MSLQEFFHLVNPSTQKKPFVEQFFKNHSSLKYAFVEKTSHPTHLETIVDWALNEKKTKLAVWGGDGSWNRVIQNLYSKKAEKNILLTLIPVGTCNDFARAYKLPDWKIYIERAMSTTGKEMNVDIGLVKVNNQERIFMNNTGFGRSTLGLHRKKPNAIKDIFELRPKKINCEWKQDGKVQRKSWDVLFGMICNAPYFNAGLHFSTNVQSDDGLLNGFFETPQFKVKLLWRLMKGRKGEPLLNSKTISIESNLIRIESEQDIFCQADGEPVCYDAFRSIEFSILPKALKFIQFS